jgi:hypothetical protein
LQDVPRIARTIGTQQVRSGSQHFAARADAADEYHDDEKTAQLFAYHLLHQ